MAGIEDVEAGLALRRSKYHPSNFNPVNPFSTVVLSKRYGYRTTVAVRLYGTGNEHVAIVFDLNKLIDHETKSHSQRGEWVG